MNMVLVVSASEQFPRLSEFSFAAFLAQEGSIDEPVSGFAV